MNFDPIERDQEQGIDRALQALANAQAPAGMEERILARLAQTEQAQATSSPRGLAGIFAMPWLAGGFALAGALALCIAFAMLPPHRPTSQPSTAFSLPDERTVPPEVPPAPIDLARRALPPTAITASAKRPAHNGQPPAAESARPDLASFPAPEAPLTEQEKLLLHIAHHPGPAEFELLNAEARDQIAQASQADFNQFFPQPIPQEIFYESHQPKP